MTRKLALLASLAAMIFTAACADMGTAPHRDCQVSGGSASCDGSTGGH